jgi:uncharacterized protein YggE
MTDPQGPVLSVRGVAHRTVAPDSATIYAAVETIADSKAAALVQAAEAVDLITADLRDLGGRAQEAGSARHPITWSSRTVATHPEQQKNSEKQRVELTGRVHANVALYLTVRDFDLLDPVGDRLAHHEMFNIHGVNWSVDDDNPAWPLVRAEAIHAAIRQGRDYAAALGCSLAEIEHVADAGLLGGDGPGRSGRVVMGASARASGEMGGGPSLDPVPQEVSATIEARFRATPVTLGSLPMS